MIGTIRRHQTWLWAVIITVTVISFVVYFSPYQKMSRAERRTFDVGTVDGRRIGQEAFVNALQEVRLRYLINSGGRRPEEDSNRNFEREALQWLYIIDKIDQAGIHIARDKVAEAARRLVLSSLQGPGGRKVPPELAERVLTESGFRPEDLERYVTHWLGVQELIAAVGVSGKLATPQEIQDFYVRERQELATEAVIFEATNYLAKVTVTADALNQFYTNQMAEYRVPERVQVSYVRFSVTNFLAKTEEAWNKTNLNEVVEDNFQRLGTNYYKDAKTPDEVRARLRQDLIRERALPDAHRQANAFASSLIDLQNPRAEDLRLFAKTNGVKVEVTEPFSADEPPKELEVQAEFVTAAFKLTPEQPLAGPIRGRDGYYVIALEKKFPEETPPLDRIRDKVVADFRAEEAKAMARQNGTAFSVMLTNGMAAGKSFDAVCAEARLRPVPLPPFSISSQELPPGTGDWFTLNQLKQAAFTTPVGKASGFEWTAQGGFILFVKTKLPVDPARMKEELPSFAQSVRQQWQNEAFNEWLGVQFSRSVRSVLLERKEPPPNLSSRKAGKS